MSGCFLQPVEAREPCLDSVPTGAVLVHQTFIPSLNRPQVAERRCGYGGANKADSVERDSPRKEQFLVAGARQNAFCEREDALYVERLRLEGGGSPSPRHITKED